MNSTSPSPDSELADFVRQQLVRWTSRGVCGFVLGAVAINLLAVVMGLAGPWIAYLILLLMAPPCALALIVENEPETEGALRRTAGIWALLPTYLCVQLGVLGVLHPWWLAGWVVTGLVSALLYWWGSRD